METPPLWHTTICIQCRHRTSTYTCGFTTIAMPLIIKFVKFPTGNQTKTRRKIPLLPKTKTKLKEIFKDDYEFYEVLKQRFHNLYRTLRESGALTKKRKRRPRSTKMRRNIRYNQLHPRNHIHMNSRTYPQERKPSTG